MFKELFTETITKFPKIKDQTPENDKFASSNGKEIIKDLKANFHGYVQGIDNMEDYPPAKDNRYFFLIDGSNIVAVVDGKTTIKDAKKVDVYIEEYGKPVLVKNITPAKAQKILRDAFNSGWGPSFSIRYGK